MTRPAAYGWRVEGTPFGRYRIELLGRGGMGEVWRAHDTETDRIVAIKVLPAHFSDNEDFKKRFRREAHAAARLNTPHAVPIHHYGEIDGRLYVDMRLIEGRDLQTVLADGPMEPSRAVRIIEGIALALHAAHKVGLVHRDVKPSNILLDDNDFAYLIDFGIARAADETRLTKSGNAIGTFHYIAPERLGTRAEEDARADIYSLACVLYECLTGRPPFDEATMARLVAAHLNTPPPQPSATQPNVPAQFDEVIATGMAKDPDNRYATTVELANAAPQVTLPFIGLSNPEGLAVDSVGNVYVTDYNNNQVLELPVGSSTQVELPFTGLGWPVGAAVDSAGNVYVISSDIFSPTGGRVLKLPGGVEHPGRAAVHRPGFRCGGGRRRQRLHRRSRQKPGAQTAGGVEHPGGAAIYRSAQSHNGRGGGGHRRQRVRHRGRREQHQE